MMFFDGIRTGNVYPPTQTVAELLGRPATTLTTGSPNHITAALISTMPTQPDNQHRTEKP